MITVLVKLSMHFEHPYTADVVWHRTLVNGCSKLAAAVNVPQLYCSGKAKVKLKCFQS